MSKDSLDKYSSIALKLIEREPEHRAALVFLPVLPLDNSPLGLIDDTRMVEKHFMERMLSVDHRCVIPYDNEPGVDDMLKQQNKRKFLEGRFAVAHDCNDNHWLSHGGDLIQHGCVFIARDKIPKLPTRSSIMRVETVGKDKADTLTDHATCSRRLILADRGVQFAEFVLEHTLPEEAPHVVLVDLTPHVGNFGMAALERLKKNAHDKDAGVRYVACPRDTPGRGFLHTRCMQ